jgi:putative flippase GtrA
MTQEAVAHRRSIPIYVGAGGIATASHYAFTVAAVELFGMAPLWAATLGYATGAIVKYCLNYTIAFRSTAPHRHAVARYLLAQACLLALNSLFFELLQRAGMHYMVAQGLTTLLLIAPGYVKHRAWVFR